MALTLGLDGQDNGDVVAVFPSVAAARSFLERTATWALALLDDLDGDPEKEPSDGSIGDTGVSCITLSQEHWAQGPIRRFDSDELEDGGDDEYTLGWSENVGQLALTATIDADLTAVERHGAGFFRIGERRDAEDMEEDDPAGGNIEDEPQHDDADDEPTLGATTANNQVLAWGGPTYLDDAEPSLGWSDKGSQLRLHTSSDDREDDGDDREPEIGV